MRVLLIDPEDRGGQVLARRLRAQGYDVDVHTSPADGASAALAEPPAAVVADLWMPGISGVQLCRLLRSEPSTIDVPVILRATTDEPRNRFWAERAGATDYVQKGRMGVLVRSLGRSVDPEHQGQDGFFTHLPDGHVDIRDRIAAQLDQALFDSVVAAEVRALGTCETFERLFDLFSQLVAQITNYRWLAVCTHKPARIGLHAHPIGARRAMEEARFAMGITGRLDTFIVEDEDANPDSEDVEPIIAPIQFGTLEYGFLAMAPARESAPDATLVPLLAVELGGPLRMATLIEESQLLAATDALTGLSNRRSFTAWLEETTKRARTSGAPLALALLDVDHFKAVNDNFGHAVGDLVLEGLGKLLSDNYNRPFRAARWGGEEFVLAMPNVGKDRAPVLADKLRGAIEAMVVNLPDGQTLSITASIGLAQYDGENVDLLIDRADQAMYLAKTSGRNQVRTDFELEPSVGERDPLFNEEAA